MNAIFITRDKTEFDRFQAGAQDQLKENWCTVILSDSDMASSGAYAGSCKTADVNADEKFRMVCALVGKPDPKVDTMSVIYKILMRQGPSGCEFTLVVRGTDRVCEARTSVMNSEFSENVCKSFVAKIGCIVKAVAASEHLQEGCLSDNISLFVHWSGMTDPEEVEKRFNEWNADYAAILKCKSVASFAVSSRRSDCFDVSGSGVIVPPCGEEEVGELVKKFEKQTRRSLFEKAALGDDLEEDERREIRKTLKELKKAWQFRKNASGFMPWLIKVVAELPQSDSELSEGKLNLCAKILKEGWL